MSGVAQLTFWMLAYFPVVTPLIFKPVIFLDEVLLFRAFYRDTCPGAFIGGYQDRV